MTFDEIMRKIAHKADNVTGRVMDQLATGRVEHEDDLTGDLHGALREGLRGVETGGVTWDTAVLSHRRGGAEGRYGADLLIHVALDTPQHKYSKGVLVQAKRISPSANMTTKDHGDLLGQCSKMLAVTPSAFVFAYDPAGMRVASATKVVGAASKALYDQCDWTAYRFYLELFRCPVGDPRITSADVKQLYPKYALGIRGKGDLSSERRVRA